jgi:hypothetical protein
MSDVARERLRILRACANGRLKVNSAGRYVIDGEKRPDRKVRESLMYSDPQMVCWPSSLGGSPLCRITVDGRDELRNLEAMVGANP